MYGPSLSIPRFHRAHRDDAHGAEGVWGWGEGQEPALSGFRDAVPDPDASDDIPLLNPIDHVHPFHDVTEDGVPAVEVRLR